MMVGQRAPDSGRRTHRTDSAFSSVALFHRVKISVITVSFNSARTIGQTLASVDTQTHPDIEHIVVDGASGDGTVSIVNAHRRPWRRVISEADRGIYDAMNKGLDLATGDYVGF